MLLVTLADVIGADAELLADQFGSGFGVQVGEVIVALPLLVGNRVIASAASCSWVRRRRVIVLKGEFGPRLKFTVPDILGSPGYS